MVDELKASAIDLILFAGQSNMAGRGDAAETAPCEAFMGREFRAVSDPAGLYPIREPFGIKENNRDGMDDGRKKTGGMVCAFVRKYYELTGHAVIAVSASKGGSSSARWVKTYAADAAMRLRRARAYLEAERIKIAHTYVLWSQGETDGDKGLDARQYFESFLAIWSILREAGAEKCFLVQTGHFNYVKYPRGAKGIKGAELDRRYEVIRRTQERMCVDAREGSGRRENGEFPAICGEEGLFRTDLAGYVNADTVTCLPDVYMVASFEPYLGMMKDLYHYRQQAYNEVGETAAGNMAAVILKDFGYNEGDGS